MQATNSHRFLSASKTDDLTPFPLTQKRAAIYVRVSARGQEVYGTSLITQEEHCRAFCDEQNLSISDQHIFREVHSGKEYRDRPKMIALRQAARNHEFDVVVVYAFDRFARRQVHQAVIIDDLQQHGVSILCVTENYDDSPVGQFMRNTYAFMAEIEREKILERSIRGKLGRVKSGKMLGQGQACYGYDWNTDHAAYIIRPDEAEVVKRIFSLAADGTTIRRIAIMLTDEGIPTRKHRPRWDLSIIQHMLRNSAYIGKAVAFKRQQVHEPGKKTRTVLRDEAEQIVLPDGLIPPLIDLETFEKAQQLLDSNKQRAIRNNKHPENALLRSGFARCGYCNGAMVAINDNTNQITVYRCGRGQRNRAECQYLTITTHILDDAAWAFAVKIIQNPAIVAKQVAAKKKQNPIETERASLHRRLDEIKQEEANLIEMGQYATSPGTLRTLGQRLAALEREKKDIEKEDFSLQDVEGMWRKTEEKLAKFEQWCHAVSGKLHTVTYQQKRNALEILGVKALVYYTAHTPRFTVEIHPDCVDGIKDRITV